MPTPIAIEIVADCVGSCTEVAVTLTVPDPVGVRVLVFPEPDKVAGPVKLNVTAVLPPLVTITLAIKLAVCKVSILYLSDDRVIAVTTGTGTVLAIVIVSDFEGSPIEVAVTVIVPGPVATKVRLLPLPERVAGPVKLKVTFGLNAPVPTTVAIRLALPPTSSADWSLIRSTVLTVGTAIVIGTCTELVGSSVLTAVTVALPTPAGAV